jgi:protein-tyrosine kinase
MILIVKNMSEIFDWLRKMESDRGKRAAVVGLESIEEPSRSTPDSKLALARTFPSTRGFSEFSAFDISDGNPIIRGILEVDSFGREQYRLLRTKLSLKQREDGLKKVLITSAGSEEGKTITSCILAGVLTQEPGRRIVLVEADLRKPGAAKALGCTSPNDMVGLCHILRGEATVEDALLKSNGMDLFLLPSGGKPDNPAELLSSPNLELTFKALTDAFDWVLIDSPPILVMADTLLLAAMADFAVLVIRSEFTPGKVIQDAVQRIGPEKIIGIAMNRVKRFRPSRYYSQYYSPKLGSKM